MTLSTRITPATQFNPAAVSSLTLMAPVGSMPAPRGARPEVTVVSSAHLQGSLEDLLSDYQDIAAALSTGHGTGHCLAASALQAQLDACQAEIAAVQAQLFAWDGRSGVLAA